MNRFSLMGFAKLSAGSPLLLPIYRPTTSDNRCFIALQSRSLAISSFELIDLDKYEVLQNLSIRIGDQIPTDFAVGDRSVIGVSDDALGIVHVIFSDQADKFLAEQRALFAHSPFARIALTTIIGRNLTTLFSQIHDPQLPINALWREIEYRAAQREGHYWAPDEATAAKDGAIDPHELLRQFSSHAEAVEWLMGVRKKNLKSARTGEVIWRDLGWAIIWIHLYRSNYDEPTLLSLANSFICENDLTGGPGEAVLRHAIGSLRSPHLADARDRLLDLVVTDSVQDDVSSDALRIKTWTFYVEWEVLGKDEALPTSPEQSLHYLEVYAERFALEFKISRDSQEESEPDFAAYKAAESHFPTALLK